jgi:toxin-antitoxin system PIN domain toxin
MLIPDVNILVYAYMSAMPQHRPARRFWEGMLNGDEPVGLIPVVLFGFLRIATNRRIFSPPLAVEAAIVIVEQWLKLPAVRLLISSPDELVVTLELLRRQGTAANLTTDAQIAAAALSQDATVISNDADLKRFGKVRVQNPF